MRCPLARLGPFSSTNWRCCLSVALPPSLRPARLLRPHPPGPPAAPSVLRTRRKRPIWPLGSTKPFSALKRRTRPPRRQVGVGGLSPSPAWRCVSRPSVPANRPRPWPSHRPQTDLTFRTPTPASATPRRGPPNWRRPCRLRLLHRHRPQAPCAGITAAETGDPGPGETCTPNSQPAARECGSHPSTSQHRTWRQVLPPLCPSTTSSSEARCCTAGMAWN